MMSDAFSAIIITGAFVFPDMMDGMMEASTTLRFLMPLTLKFDTLKLATVVERHTFRN